MSAEPSSKLTLERPDIWARALLLATGLTGMEYAPKTPLADGTIYACGGMPARIPTPSERIKERESEIDRMKGLIIEHPENRDYYEMWIKRHEEQIERIKRENGIATASRVFVPEGAVEWLLHEVGHWVVATSDERLLPNYGYGSIKKIGWGAAREWQAWAFEEIILAPWGPARELAPPSQQDGAAFSRIGPMPNFALRHANSSMRELGVDIAQWRQVYGDWIAWGRA